MQLFERSALSPLIAARVLGALALMGAGAVHLQQFFSLYSAVPTIGTLFVLNFLGATAIGLGLLAPLKRILGRRADTAVSLLALAGVAMAGTAFVFLLIAEHATLFGWTEAGYYSTAVVLALITEGITVVLLGAFAVARLARRPTPQGA